jgi:hypothetical protein
MNATPVLQWLPLPLGRVGRLRRAIRTPLSPRMATAAVRIPDPRFTQLALAFSSGGPQIFIHEGARQALERRFALVCRGPVQLSVTDNRRRMVSFTRHQGTLRLRLHMMFLGAPERVLDALVKYVVGDDRDASQLVDEYIQRNSFRIRGTRAASGPLRTQGKIHDLSRIHADLSERYFGGSVADVPIVWGRRTRPRSQKRVAIKLGSYSAVERLVRIHPALDAAWVPRYFVHYIAYHELLHHVIPAVRLGGRAILHSPEFLQRERDYRHFDRAIEWERKHLGRLLRSR